MKELIAVLSFSDLTDLTTADTVQSFNGGRLGAFVLLLAGFGVLGWFFGDKLSAIVKKGE
jgi:hypothetical protein